MPVRGQGAPGCRARRSRRLLLGNAVDAPAAAGQLRDINLGHFPIGKGCLYDRAGSLIAGYTDARHNGMNQRLKDARS
jgi:hypothetical protein